MKIILTAWKDNRPEHVNLRNVNELYHMLRTKYGDNNVSLCLGRYLGKDEMSVCVNAEHTDVFLLKTMMQRYEQETALLVWSNVGEFYQPRGHNGAAALTIKWSKEKPEGDYTYILKTGEYLYVVPS